MARKKRRGQRRKRVTFYSRTGRGKRKKVSFMVSVGPKKKKIAYERKCSTCGEIVAVPSRQFGTYRIERKQGDNKIVHTVVSTPFTTKVYHG